MNRKPRQKISVVPYLELTIRFHDKNNNLNKITKAFRSAEDAAIWYSNIKTLDWWKMSGSKKNYTLPVIDVFEKHHNARTRRILEVFKYYLP